MAADPEREGLKGLRVLVLDDEDSVREVLCLGLGDAGCEVQVAADGRQGLQLMLDRDFDVAVVDLKMRHMDGFAFLSEAMRMRPWMGIVIISGFLDDATKYHASGLGVQHVLAKPFKLPELQAAVLEEARSKKGRLGGSTGKSIERFEYELNILRNLTRSAIQSESLLKALQRLSAGVAERLPAAAVGILTMEEDETLLSMFMHEKVSPKFVESVEAHTRRRYYALSGRQLPESLRLEINGEPRAAAGPARPGTVCTVPVIAEGEIGGLLTLAAVPKDAYTEGDMTFLYHAANNLATVLIAFRRMRQLAIRDGLTDLYNRRHILEELEYIRQMAKRYDFPIGIAIIDVDRFKNVNDQHGHVAGDEVLVELAGLLKGSVTRASDMVGRYGGDELIVILPGTGLDDVWAFGERLLHNVRRYVFLANRQKLELTVSVGVTSIEGPDALDMPCKEMLSQADQALYTAKEKGRNLLCAWSEGVNVELDKPATTAAPMEWLSGRLARDPYDVARRSILEVLSSLLAAGKDVIGGHSAKAREMALILGRRLGMSDRELRDLGDGAVLHDIGKLAIPGEILSKPGPLTAEEWQVMRKHPEIGYEILRPFDFMGAVADIVRSHQEWFDGSGYPRGLKGNQISLGARIVAVLDAYEAMRSDRPYRKKLSREKAIEALRNGSGTQFDPDVVDAFLKSLPAIERVLEEAGEAP